jgi:hypothetical protein
MRKMALKVDDLQVESFATSMERTRSGTVAAHESYETEGLACMTGYYGDGTCDTTCYELACGCTDRGGTCDVSCGGTCQAAETCNVEGCDFTNYNCPSGVTRPGCC